MDQGKRLLAFFGAGLLLAALAFGGTYEVDSAHTQIQFKVKHLGISTVTGKFNEFAGSFDLDPSDPGTLSARAIIKTGSIDTDNDDRDKHLRSPDFFDAERYPEIRFVSTKVEPIGGNGLRVHGDLTIRGVTKPIVLEGKFGGAVKGPMGEGRAAFSASGTINRKDFGVSWNKVLDSGGLVVSEEVTIVLEVEGVSRAS